jgi:hypothetical protein
LLITGCRSPVYNILVKIFPLFGLPYPVSWRIMEHLGIALLAGISAHRVLNSRRPLSRRWLTAFLWLVLVGFVIGSGRLIPFAEAEGPKPLGGDYLSWLWRSPFIYLEGGIVGTVILIIIARRKSARVLVVIAAVLEVILTGFFATSCLNYYYIYDSTPREVWYRRYRRPSDSPYFRWTGVVAGLKDLSPPATGRERSTFYCSRLDEMATLHGGAYLMGTSCRPMAPRLTEVLGELTRGWPYDLRLLHPGSRYLPNMSVRHLILEDAEVQIPSSSSTRRIAGEKTLFDYRLQNTLPRVFSQDRIIIANRAEARNELLNGDLRRGAFLEEEKWNLVIRGRSAAPGDRRNTPPKVVFDYRETGEKEDLIEITAHFDRLQNSNRILRVWSPTPNRMNIELEVETPALLITTDLYYPGWEVRVDGRAAEPLEVNYLQRGVWLERGRHRVEWILNPPSLKWGLLSIIGGLLGLSGLIVYNLRPDKSRRRQ